jgi:acetyltransferase-like isoleucine patch superfamily enzyme
MGNIAIFGAGDFARGLLTPCRAAAAGGDIVFVVGQAPIGSVRIRGHRLAAVGDLMAGSLGERRMVVGLDDGHLRRRVAETLTAAGFSFQSLGPSVRADGAIDAPEAIIGEGAILGADCHLAPQVRVGVHFQCGPQASLAEGDRIGDFVTFAPRVVCEGWVSIGDGVHLGTGARVRAGVRVGEGAFVGPGMVVAEDLPPGAVLHRGGANRATAA